MSEARVAQAEGACRVAASRASGILAVTFPLAADGEEAVNRWYETWHRNDVMRVPGFNGSRRFRSLTGELRHMTLWEVDDVAFPFSDEYRSIKLRSWKDWCDANGVDASLRGPSERQGWRELPVHVEPEPVTQVEGWVPGIRTITMEIAPEDEQDFHRWYDEEHIEDLLSKPTHRSIRRFQIEGTRRFVAAWELNDAHYHLRPEYELPVFSDWAQRVAKYRLSYERDSWEQIQVQEAVR